MPFAPAYTPLFERVVDLAIRPEHQDELTRARADYFTRTGEVFDDDRSFDVRMQAFLDWYVFDRPLAPSTEPPARALMDAFDPGERRTLRLLSRTIHGLFQVRRNTVTHLALRNLLTDADYRVAITGPLAGVQPGDLFEGRLVPFEGRLHFSSAFVFHPRDLERRIRQELARERREEPDAGVQDVIWTLSRMALRAEHYRNVPLAEIYDFRRPPPLVRPSPMRFDAASLEARRRRLVVADRDGWPAGRDGAE